MTGVPRWLILLLGVGLLAVGFASYMGWLRDPSLARSDYIGAVEVSADDAKLYRAVPFEWRINSAAGSFKGNDTAHVRIDNSGERTVVCGWLRLDKGGTSIRATRWLSEARLERRRPQDDGVVHRAGREDAGRRPATPAALRLDEARQRPRNDAAARGSPCRRCRPVHET